jgi:hypothetical protein
MLKKFLIPTHPMNPFIVYLFIMLCPLCPLCAAEASARDVPLDSLTPAPRSGIHMHPEAATLKILDLYYIDAASGKRVEVPLRRQTDHWPTADEIVFAEQCVVKGKDLLYGKTEINWLNRIYVTGRNVSEAMRLISMAHYFGHPRAMELIGNYFYGWAGVSPDPEIAGCSITEEALEVVRCSDTRLSTTDHFKANAMRLREGRDLKVGWISGMFARALARHDAEEAAARAAEGEAKADEESKEAEAADPAGVVVGFAAAGDDADDAAAGEEAPLLGGMKPAAAAAADPGGSVLRHRTAPVAAAGGGAADGKLEE